MLAVILRRALAALLLLASAAAMAQPIGSSTADPSPKAANQLRGGWYPWDPYQYLDYSWGPPFLTGLDVEIQRTLERIMGVEVALTSRSWAA